MKILFASALLLLIASNATFAQSSEDYIGKELGKNIQYSDVEGRNLKTLGIDNCYFVLPNQYHIVRHSAKHKTMIDTVTVSAKDSVLYYTVKGIEVPNFQIKAIGNTSDLGKADAKRWKTADLYEMGTDGSSIFYKSLLETVNRTLPNGKVAHYQIYNTPPRSDAFIKAIDPDLYAIRFLSTTKCPFNAREYVPQDKKEKMSFLTKEDELFWKKAHKSNAKKH